MPVTSTQALRRRSGFSLVELLVVMTLLSVIGTAITALLVRQQRFHTAVISVTESRARMRDISTILPTDMRGVSSVGNDFLEIGLTALQFRAFVGTTIFCNASARAPSTSAVVEIPPRQLTSGSVLSAWINDPQAGDVVFLYDDGTEIGNADDRWRAHVITAVDTSSGAAWCPQFTANDAAIGQRLRFTVSPAPRTTVKLGAPIRIAREVRYSIYQASDDLWYVGYQQCTPDDTEGVPGDCEDAEVLAGPVLPATTSAGTSGLFFLYYNQRDQPVTSVSYVTNADGELVPTDTIARIEIGIRTSSAGLHAGTTAHTTATDSLMFTIGIRNRI
jgi:prepilin-type N-terminal cleavage/methylation domain-containing protein